MIKTQKNKFLKLLFDKYFLLAVLFLSFWFGFKNGGITEVSYRFSGDTKKAEVLVDQNLLYEIDLPLFSEVTLLARPFHTFLPKRIDQKVIDYFLIENGVKSYFSAELFPKMIINGIGGKTIGVRVKNISQLGFHLNLDQGKSFSVYLRPLRENDWSVEEVIGQKSSFLVVGSNLPLNSWQQLKRLLFLVTLPFPYCAAMCLFLSILFYVKKIKSAARYTDSTSPGKRNYFFQKTITLGPILLIAVFSFFWLFHLNQKYLGGIPHVGDAVSYLLQAKFIASGNVCGVPEITESLFAFFKGWGALSFNGGKWCGFYPYGHPLALALGVYLGNAGVIPPFLASLSLILIFFLGKKTEGMLAGLLATLIVLVSPFFQMNAASFMSHNTGIFYEILGIFFLILAVEKNKNLFYILSAIFLGLFFNTRPLITTGFIIPILFYLLLKKIKWYKIFLFAFYWILFSATFFLYNHEAFGHFWKTPYLTANASLLTQGETFWTDYLLVFQNHLIIFLQVFHGWAFELTLLLIYLPILVIKSAEIKLFALLALGITITSAFFNGGTYAITYGPRYWLEIVPWVSLLMASLFSFFWGMTKIRLLKIIILLVPALFLSYTTLGWLTGNPVLWKNIGFTPETIHGLKSFNNVDNRLIKKANLLGIKNSVIFVKECGNWWCYGSVLPQNNPELNSDIVWASDLGERNIELMNHYPKRSFYLADYDLGEISPIKQANLINR